MPLFSKKKRSKRTPAPPMPVRTQTETRVNFWGEVVRDLVVVYEDGTRVLHKDHAERHFMSLRSSQHKSGGQMTGMSRLVAELDTGSASTELSQQATPVRVTRASQKTAAVQKVVVGMNTMLMVAESADERLTEISVRSLLASESGCAHVLSVLGRPGMVPSAAVTAALRF